jgi:hypothetical protein
MLIHVTNKILLRGENLIIGKGHLTVINEVSHIPGEEEDGPKDQVDWCLVPPMFAQDVLPERCIIKTYFDAIASRTQWKDKALCCLCSLACGWVELSTMVLLSTNM